MAKVSAAEKRLYRIFKDDWCNDGFSRHLDRDARNLVKEFSDVDAIAQQQFLDAIKSIPRVKKLGRDANVHSILGFLDAKAAGFEGNYGDFARGRRRSDLGDDAKVAELDLQGLNPAVVAELSASMQDAGANGRIVDGQTLAAPDSQRAIT